MEKYETFNNEINLIKSETIKDYVIKTLKETPEIFWKIPASSTGKYHPECTNKEGGLIIHVKRVVYICDRLSFGWNITDLNRDMVIASSILHDIAKCGKDSGIYENYVNHPITAANMFKKTVNFNSQDITPINKTIIIRIANCINYHMGLWTPKSIVKPLSQYTSLELLVYTSDYMASTKTLVTPVDGSYTVKDI